MPFNFPDPAVSTTATNPVTGAVYQWKDDPGKWVLTGGAAEKATPPVTIDLLPPENPQKGDLWIHEESLIEYAWDGTQWFEVGSSCGGDSTEEEEEEVLNLPFVNSYILVSPDDFTGADGTATLETDAYVNGDDSYLSSAVEIARFAELDLNGRKHEKVNIDESFELSPTTYDANETSPYAYGKFEVTNTLGNSEYAVNFDSGRAFKFIEGDTIYYRPTFTGEYVKKKGGDTMEGPLQITGPRVAGDDVDNPDLVSSLQVLNVDNTQNSGLHLRHSGTTKLYVGANDLAVAADIKFNRGAGTVIKTNQQDLFNIGLNEVAYLGETIEEEDLVTKKYVDDNDSVLANQIIELEEEIDALAPAVDRGVWTFNLGGFAGNQGQMSMYDDDYSGVGSPTPFFKSAKSIWLNQADNAGTIHGFGNVKQGNLIELFVEGEADYGLFEVIAPPHDESGGAASWWVIEVQYLRALSETSDAEPLDNIRVKIFEAPSGGDASEFVLKSGDNMEGALDMEGASGRNKILNLDSPTSEYDAANKEYVDQAVVGSSVSAGRVFQGASGYPTSYNNFVTNSAYPGYVNQIYFHPDFIETHIDGPGKTFRSGGWIYIYDTSGNKETMGMYLIYSLNTDSNGYKYLSVHGMGANRNLITGTNYGIGIACSFDS